MPIIPIGQVNILSLAPRYTESKLNKTAAISIIMNSVKI